MTAPLAPSTVSAAPSTSSPPLAGTQVSNATASSVHYLYITVHKDAVTMPTRLVAGTYYVHVSTPDQVNSIQVVRPPSTLSASRFSALFMNYHNALYYGTSSVPISYNRWITSALFIGGATAVPSATDPSLMRTYLGRGVFAITLWPGRYWFYASMGAGMPQLASPRNAPRIYQITVVGTGSRSALPTVGVVRFAASGGVTKSFIPRVLPREGFLLALGTPGTVSTLRFARLLPGVTDAQIKDGHTCLNPDAPQDRMCFQTPTDLYLGGAVSGGASAFWYYRLPPGDYVVGQATPDSSDNTRFYGQFVTRVTIR